MKSWEGQLSDEQEKWIETYSENVPIDIIRVQELETKLKAESIIEDSELVRDNLN